MRSRRPAATVPGRPSRHGRHGRQGRSSVVRPPLPPLDGRIDEFDLHVGTAAEFLRSAWDELRDVSFEVGAMPPASDADGIPRWSTDTTARRIVIYRLPLERLDGLLREDDLHRRTFVEGTVFRAAAEYLGREPWDLGPGRYRL